MEPPTSIPGTPPRVPESATTDQRRGASNLTTVAWVPNGELELGEWSAVGRRFGEIVRCSQWWLGDWINYGNAKFGERYSRAATITGYDVQSLMNMVYVASRFGIYRRRENLSWSHHAALAAVDPEEQDRWLDRAIAEKLSVADLRLELQSARRIQLKGAGEEDAPEAPPPDAAGETLTCPQCGHRVPLPTPIAPHVLRLGAAALLVIALMLATPALARVSHAASAPRARTSRSLNVTDTAKLHLISTSGSLLNEEGTATGAMPGKVKSKFKIGASVSSTTTFYPAGGSITIRGVGALHSSGVIASFGGSMKVIGATGRYAHARGSGGFYGVVNRRTWTLTVQTTGRLNY